MFLGLDGGGTKSAFVLVDRHGQILARYQSSGSYYLQIGMEGLSTVIRDGVDEVLKQAQLPLDQIECAYLGLPAYGEDSRVQNALDAVPKTIFGDVEYRCGNDMVCGWAGSLGGKDGINIVSGTGSIGYGEALGRTARAGGWGELFSDEGSAYWLAVSGLNLFSKMSDGRMARGPLYEIYRRAFALDSDLDLSGIVMSDIASNRDLVAALASHVASAAEVGDAAAITLYERAAGELASIIIAIANQLPFNKDALIDVSYSGGVFASGALILEPLKAALGRDNNNYRLSKPLYSPDIGAALYAAKLKGVNITPQDIL